MLVDQAVLLLGKYGDSTLAVHGIQFLSALLEETTNRQPSKHHARLDRKMMAYPQEGNPLSWPLEDRQTTGGMRASKRSNRADNRSRAVTSTAISLHQRPQLGDTPSTSVVGDAGVHDASVQNSDDSPLMDADGIFGTVEDNGVSSDMSWWTDLFSDYIPVQSGFENLLFIENLLTSAP